MNIRKRLARKRLAFAAGALICLALGAALCLRGRSLWFPAYRRLRGRRTVESALQEYGCIAVGDTAIEELFTLVAASGASSAKVLNADVFERMVRSFHDANPATRNIKE